jgi:hypothetical protein
MAEATRPHAFETDDGALRCYLDQLPPDRCIFCDTRTPARLIRVAGPVHSVSSFEALADGSTADRVLAGAALMSAAVNKRPMPGYKAQSMQTKGRAWLAVCPKCSPKVVLPAVCGLVFLISTVVYATLQGAAGMLQIAVGGLLALVAFTVALRRLTLRVGEIDEDDHMFKLRNVAPEIMRETLALGPAPHPQAVARQNQIRHHVSGKV